MAALGLMISLTAVSCKKKVSDTDLTTNATTAIQANPNASVEVKDGVAHLSGTYASEAERDAAIASLKATEGIKEVMDMTTIAVTEPVVTVDANTDANIQRVNDAIKDYPGVKAELVNGEVVITGDVTSEQARNIKMSVDGLNLGKVQYNYIVK